MVEPGQRLNVLYLFVGAPRKADLKECLHALSNSQQFSLHIREVDIERGPEDDLTNDTLWSDLMVEIKAGRYQVIVLSPPCGTWSRVRFQWNDSPGPRPVRNRQHPWGFPWLSKLQMAQVESANMFVSKSIELAKLISNLGGSVQCN